ncbi:TatD family hydrolase [Methylophaga sp.]|uniref:TatD family hydrolase n=1 Tax=Methylophaga sp. TaxID=2024840 RepID=UPI0013FF30B5|nr:TatD family hydrolase [Methylophaga sp.]MTI62665.1 TatD family deoxyribonuclease [Methylophaga sp.]
MMPLIDSHCHLDFSAFDDDRQEVLDHCSELGLTHIIVPGVTRESWPNLIETCSHSEMLRPALGLHPMFMASHQVSDLDELRQAVETQQPVAIGEIGLDFFLNGHDKNAQTALFEAQINLAIQFGLPVILHVRKAHDEVLKVLRRVKGLQGGIVHAFNGSMQQAEFYMQQGFLFGVGGALTYPRAQKLQRLFTDLPLSSIVLETDAPDMPLAGHQGERNSPAMIPQVLEKLAELRDEPAQLIAETTSSNCLKLLKLA